MREPKQVLGVPYKIVDGEILYAVFHRKHPEKWQFLSGGVEEGESNEMALIREIQEETGLDVQDVFSLNSIATIPKEFVGGHEWSEQVTVIPEHAFCFKLEGDITLSDEHDEFRWVNYDKAMELLRHESNKTALWETNYRIKN